MLTHDTSGADPAQTLRALVELAALDEARALKLLTAQAHASGEDEMPRLCAEVDRFAARHNVDLTRGLSRFWVVEFRGSVADLCGAVVSANDAATAVEAARAFAGDPGGTPCARQIPRQNLPAQVLRERALSAEELAELGDVTSPRHDA